MTSSIALSCLVAIAPVQAQVLTDGSTPTFPGLLLPGDCATAAGGCDITGGTLDASGRNLFHSFSLFSVPALETIRFSNDLTSVQNVIGRVTGGVQSDIFGVLETGGLSPDFNLFLINPSGIVFGPGAVLNVNGAFVASTANALEFGTDGILTTSAADIPAPTLTVDPSAFLFNQIAAQPIQVDPGATLSAGGIGNPGSLLLVGGDVLVDGGTLQGIDGSSVEVGGFRGVGSVGLLIDGNDVNLNTAAIDGLSGANVTLTNGALLNVGSLSNDAGDIVLTAGTLTIAGGTRLSSSTFGPGDAGLVRLLADTVSIDNSTFFSTAEPGSTGSPGGILIEANNIFLNNNAGLTTRTSSGAISDSAGVILLRADETISLANNSGIFSTVDQGATGDAGGILLDADTISLDNAQLSTTNSSSGIAGDIGVIARTQASVTNSLITSESNTTETVDFGTIEISARQGSVLLSQSTISAENAGSGFAGDIGISGLDQVSIVNGTTVSSDGNFGRILIGQTDVFRESVAQRQVTIADSRLTTSHDGTDRAGDIGIEGIEGVAIANSSIFSDTNGAANAGNVAIGSAGSVVVSNSIVTSEVLAQGTGDAGTVSVISPSITLTDNTQLRALTLGQGDAGEVSLEAINGEITIANNSGLFSTVEDGAIGEAGGVSITTGSLTLSNFARLSSSTLGTGDAGIVSIEATGSVSLFDQSGIFSGVDTTGRGNAGGVLIEAETVSLSDRATITTETRGVGDGGIIVIQATGDVSASGSGTLISSNVEQGATGNTLGILIESRSLFLDGGAEVQALTRGNGNAGTIVVDVLDTVDLNGVSLEGGFSTGLLTSTEGAATGPGGVISVSANTLRLADGAVLSARTQTSQPGGNILVDVVDLELTGGGQILTTTFADGVAGSIIVNATNQVVLEGSDPTAIDRFLEVLDRSIAEAILEFGPVDGPRIGEIRALQTFDNVLPGSSGLFANALAGSQALAGGIAVITPTLGILDGATITVNNQGSGPAGDIAIAADSFVFLDNDSSIAATTALSGQGGNIFLDVGNLLYLRRSSQISTTAGTEQSNGDGGNIRIETLNPTGILAIFGFPTNDNNITANAFTGAGGSIRINATTFFGDIAERPLNPDTNDIDASSTFGINGTVISDPLDVDFSRGLAPLPVNVVDATGLIAQTCTGGGATARQRSEFVVTGRGGLPPNPSSTLQNEAVVTDWVSVNPENEATDARLPENATQSDQIVEAQGWAIASNGEIVLTADATAATPQTTGIPTATCRGS